MHLLMYYADLIAMDNTYLPTLRREQELLARIADACLDQGFAASPEQTNALCWYAMTGFLYVNAYLRGGRTYEDAHAVTPRINSIQPLEAPAGCVLWRGMALPEDCDHPQEGETFHDAGFVSCSVVRSFAESMTARYVRRAERAERTRYVVRIEVPESAPIIPAYFALLAREAAQKHSRPFRIMNEAEILLGPGANFDIHSVRQRADGVHVVRAQLRLNQVTHCEIAA